MATNNYKPIGVTGLNVNGGRINEEFLTELRGDKWRRVIREMADQDETVAASLLLVEMIMRQVEFSVEPFSTDSMVDGESTKVVSPDDKERAVFVDDCLYDMANTWDDTIAEILTMLPWGFAPLEQTYKRRADGRIGWLSWSIRAQDSVDDWVWNPDGSVAGFWQMAPPNYRRVFIPAEKILLFRTTSRKENPEGKSILRGAYRPWYFKKNIANSEAIGIERNLNGFPVMYVPPEITSADATDDQKAAYAEAKNIVVNMRVDEQQGVVLPAYFDADGNRMFEIMLLSTSGTGQFDTDIVLRRYDRGIAMAMMTDVILIGHENVGSKALVGDRIGLLSTALTSWLDSICEVINRFAIPKLFKLNGWPVDQLPRLVHGDIEKINLVDLADYVSKLSGSIIEPDEELERHMRQQADLPEKAKPRKQPQPVIQPGPIDSDAPDDNEDEPDDAQMSREFTEAAKRIVARGW